MTADPSLERRGEEPLVVPQHLEHLYRRPCSIAWKRASI
jgi:hypothetical protein